MTIAVFMGGSSSERDVSLSSGAAIVEGLTAAGHAVKSYDVQWIGDDSIFPAVREVVAEGIDIVFLALHGGLGENGGIQGVLETAGIVYTGSGITASAIAMDKDITKRLLIQHCIPTAHWTMVNPRIVDAGRIRDSVGYPCIVKPADQGSTVGLSLVREAGELHPAVDIAGKYSNRIMAETFVPGAELTVPILDGETLPIIEIRPAHELYDYECKYTAGMTDYIAPAPIEDALAERLRVLALDVYGLLDLRDYARIDFRLDADGIPLCFEANTLPGMTGTSLVPKSARAAGIEFPALVDRIAAMAFKRKGIR